MATFSPVNTTLTPDTFGRNAEATTPTTPRPNTAPQHSISRMDDATTPTRANFSNTLASQRPLPATQQFPAAVSMPENIKSEQGLHRGNSQYSAKSVDSEDVDMGDSPEGDEGSDEETINPDGTRTKKKKSQKFYCTDYPPCGLSFTRSEHLARHIRKHTGERPFQCHCSRRFSRLDNLRQHAQTVHVNEEIPGDSLAATGTRFQRQVRTDRTRPSGGRSRAGTAGSTGPVRGHQRNSLSASSISSVQPYVSTNDRRRPPPLQMAGGQRHSGEYMHHPESPGQYQQRPFSPEGYSTPASASYSSGQLSPRFGSAMHSPISTHSRTQSLFQEHRVNGRRLSVPSAGNPFQSPHGNTYPPPFGTTTPQMGTYSSSSSIVGSPTTSTSSIYSRRDSISSIREDDMRRRTWHPDSHYHYQPQTYGSRLQHVTTPNHYSSGPPLQAPVVPSNAPPLNNIQLPGIASFDTPQRPRTPVRRGSSPMNIDTPSRAPMRVAEPHSEERPQSQHWDINRNLSRLDFGRGTPPTDEASSWASETTRAVQAQAEHARAQPLPPQNQVRFEESPYTARSHQYYQHQSAPATTPRDSKRHGWYNGPVTPVDVNPLPIDPRLQRTSPEDSSSSEGVPGTPSSASVAEINPSIMHSNGYLEKRNVLPVHESRILPSNAPSGYSVYQHQPVHAVESSYTFSRAPHSTQQPQQQQMPKASDVTTGLDALVAAATSVESGPGAAY